MQPKTERNNEILRMIDEEGRTFVWVASQTGINEKNVRKIYHREKYYQKFPQYANKLRLNDKEVPKE